MKIIQRELYLNKLKDVVGTPDIKVITGVRRAGKSKLLDAFCEYLSGSVQDANIIRVDLGLKKFQAL